MPDPDNAHDAWCFDPVPPSGARQGGDPAQFVFEPDISALVRETLQNSNDQLFEGGERVVVTFRSERFASKRLKKLREVFDLATLQSHLASISVAHARFEGGLEMLESECMTGLWIEDRGTTGLVGDERGSGNFAALCRDRLFSEKQTAESGGSFGLGKAVLWRFSLLSTVAFYSRIAEGPYAGRERFIIKAALPFHALDDERQFSGDGWFGQLERVDRLAGDRAVSLWGDRARAAAVALGARAFRSDETGTSIFILGFGDPAADDAGETEAVETRLMQSARQSFWPALTRHRLAVTVGDSTVSADGGSVESRLAAMLHAYDERADVDTLGDTRGVVVERIAVQLPARKDGAHGAVEAHADVIIQLAEENDDDLGSLWCFRQPGMVIERRDLGKISLSARPFRAVLVCGEALRDPSLHAAALEQFLRTAEPPAHDRWVPTPRLKEVYKPGWKVALQRLFEAAEAAVRKHVVLRTETSDEGPELLRRLFKAGTVGGGRSESEFHFRNLSAEVVDGAWHFSASILPNLPTDSAWHTVIDVEFCEERGRAREGGTLAYVEADGASCELFKGRAYIAAPPGTHGVEIRGRTDPATHPVAIHEAAIELVIRSSVEVEP